jgi:thioredoxin reductase
MTIMDNGSSATYEYLIVGAGPAGLQLGYYLEKAGRNYLILEAGDAAGTFFKRYPRHRTLISINKVYTGFDDPEVNMRWDWNSLLGDNQDLLFKHYSKRYLPPADELVRYLNDYAAHYQLKVKYNARVSAIHKDDLFTVEDSQGARYQARRLIIATGVYKLYVPEIPGIELADLYTDVSVDPQDYINKRVLIVGKGNSAFETADNLIETASLIHVASPNPLKMAWRTHFVGHLRAANNNILDTYQLKLQNAIIDATITKIERQGEQLAVHFNYAHANGEQETLVYDHVILCTGFRFDASMFDDSCRPELVINDRFPKQSSEWESTNVKDLYFIGTLMQMRDFKKTSSGFIHGFRYNVEALHRIFEQKYHGQEWPNTLLNATAEALMQAVIDQVNTSSSIWQQFGFLCDLIVVSEATQQARYYKSVPLQYIQEGALGQNDHYYTVTLEYGANHDAQDPFNVTRIARDDVNRARESNFLHPVVRRFSRSKLVAEHHVIEDLAAVWRENVHIQPLLGFFERELAAVPQAQLV